MNINLFAPEVQAFLQVHKDAKAADIALKKSPFPELSSAELAGQIDARQRALKKLPLWAETAGIYFPEKINMEQCSSEQTASYKSKLIAEGSRLLDLTGGFGIDSYYFAQRAASVVHCEINAQLSDLVAHNFKVLGQDNIRCFAGDGTQLLDPTNPVDYIYSDPSRRVALKKVFLLSDCEPNIVALQDQLFACTKTIITKVAPLLDISAALKELKQVAAVYVVSLDNDCKELLFVQQQGFVGEPEIHAVRLFQGTEQDFVFDYASENTSAPSYGEVQAYLYEPDVALTKAGAFKSVATKFGLTKIAQHSHLYTSDTLLADFPGKVFSVEKTEKYGLFKKEKKGFAANVVSKNFPLKPEELRKKHKIQEAKSAFLFFTSDYTGELQVIFTQRQL